MNQEPRTEKKGARIMRQTIATAIAVSAIGILTLTPPAARAALIVEDAYNIGTGAGEYTDGSALGGQPSDTPATGGW
jgi:hypothetical protein